MKRFIKAFCLAVAVTLFTSSVALAAYGATLSVVNTSVTSYPMLSANITANVDYWAGNGYITVTGLDTRVYRGTSPVKHMLAEDRVMVSLPVNAYSNQSLELSMGNTPISSFPIIPGYADNATVGYVTTSDDASLELSDNFTYEASGYFDASVLGNITSKEAALQIAGDGSGNVTASLLGEAWSLATSNTANGWTDPTKSYDDNITSYAYYTVFGCTWSPFIELSIGEIRSNGIRFYAAQKFAFLDFLDLIDIDLYYDGAYQHLYEGSFAVNTWTTKSTAEFHNVTGMQVRFHNATGGGIRAYLKEAQFNSVVTQTSVSASGVESGETTFTVESGGQSDKWATGDVLHLNGTANSYVDCGAIYNAEPKLWVSLWFKPDTTYDAGLTDNKIIWGKQLNGTNFIYMGISANGKALLYKYDAGAQTFALFNNDISSWTAGIWYHIICSISDIEGARLIVEGGTAATNPDTSAVCNGGNFVLGAQGTGAPIRYRAIGEIANVIVGTDDLTEEEEATLYAGTAPGDETDYWYIDEGTGTNIVSYGSQVNAGTAGAATSWETSTYTGTDKTGRLCDLVLSIDDTDQRAGTNFAGKGLSVPDNDNDWTMLEGNIFPYADYLEITVGGVQKLLYEPDSILVDIDGDTATLPDESGNGNHGVITWGANPAGISLALGSFVSDYSVKTVDVTTGTDVAPDITTNVMTVEEAVKLAAMQAKDPVLYPFFDPINEVTGIPIMMMYEVFFFMLAVMAMFALGRFGHMTIMVIAGLLIMGAGVAWGVYDFWLIIILVLAGGGFIWMQGRQGA